MANARDNALSEFGTCFLRAWQAIRKDDALSLWLREVDRNRNGFNINAIALGKGQQLGFREFL
jgi:hypothetical protein